MPPKASETFLKAHSPEVQRLARAVLATIREAMPKAKETVRTGWKAIGFSNHGAVMGEIGVALYSKHVNLYFMRGWELDDPEGLRVHSTVQPG